MITKVWNRGCVLWQDYISLDCPEQPILIHVDNADIIVLEQNGQSIIVHPKAIDELCQLLKTYKPVKQKKAVTA